MFHTSTHSVYLNTGQLLIGVGSDIRLKEFDGLAHRLFEGDHAVVAVGRREHPGLQRARRAARIEIPAMQTLATPDIIQARSQWDRFLPVSQDDVRYPGRVSPCNAPLATT